ncbi:MAG: thioredoxin domain-containing protein [Acidobacteriia bacterium]|nr:thioredoxin domain-containing protein [Terriglobia bacterium]
MPNRLAREKSPYLLQHAHNPVEWYPWGDEAFAKAERENKPVFLSVGYSTCHWCHVMERESFENEEIASLLNEHFVSIKVDREERPDVDRVYMLFVQAATGAGGWPMSVFLTPDRKPFFGGTYFPPDNRYGRPGFGSLLENLARAWQGDRERILETGANAVVQLRDYADVSSDGAQAGKNALDSAYNAFRRMFDPRMGGFGGAPKFPRPSVHNFLLRYYASTGNEDALAMVLQTLREMARGGMNDQIGGGFHRYSVDERWFVPHFEKMLYDQAQLAISCLEAFQITRDGQYAASARAIFDYVLRDLANADGAFFSAEDADSAPDPERPREKSEGAFYLWSKAEIDDALAPPDAQIFRARFGVEDNGNVAEDPHGEFRGRNILYQARSIEETASSLGLRPEEVRESLNHSAQRLMQVRAARPRPHLDDKVLTAWNALMISALAKGAQILGEARYLDAARAAASFLRRVLFDESRNVLLRRYRDGEAAIDGFLDDYAFLANALIDLYETSFEPQDFQFAARLAERAIELFGDPENGGFFSTRAASEDLVLRLKDDYDGAEPSGNSLMVLALLRLARMTDREDFRAAAGRALKAFGARLNSAGAGLPQMLVALEFAVGRPREIVLAGPSDPGMLAAIRRHFLPNAVILRAEQIARPMPALDGKATAYVCENYACRLPAANAEALEQQLVQ